jgi:hypothetical protein
MKNSWLEKSENRYNVSVAGLDLEALIAKIDALNNTVHELKYSCNGMDWHRKKALELLTPPVKEEHYDGRPPEQYLEDQARCIQSMREKAQLVETLFKEVRSKLVEKRGKWAR